MILLFNIFPGTSKTKGKSISWNYKINEYPRMNRFDQHTILIYMRNFLYPALMRVSELHFSDSLEQDRNGWNITKEGKQTIEFSRKPKNKRIEMEMWTFRTLECKMSSDNIPGLLVLWRGFTVSCEYLSKASIGANVEGIWQNKNTDTHISMKEHQKRSFYAKRRVKATLMTVGAILN